MQKVCGFNSLLKKQNIEYFIFDIVYINWYLNQSQYMICAKKSLYLYIYVYKQTIFKLFSLLIKNRHALSINGRISYRYVSKPQYNFVYFNSHT